jgi:hypothetical protein
MSPGIEGEGSGGYATEMSDEYKAAQAKLVSEHIANRRRYHHVPSRTRCARFDHRRTNRR